MKLLLMLIPLSLYGSAHKKYTTEQLKALKPPLSAQQFTLYQKINARAVMRSAPPMDDSRPFSPRPAARKLRRGRNRRVPVNTPELVPSAPQNAIPFPEIVLSWEGAK